MEHATSVGPVKRAACDVVPILAEAVDRRGQRGDADEGTMPERAPGKDAKPDLDLVEPTTVLRREDEADARVATEPLGGRVACARADVIGDDDDTPFTIESSDLIEKAEHHRGCSVRRNPKQHVPVLHVERREDVARPFALVFELNSRGLSWSQRSACSRALERLNAGLLVDAEHGRAGRRRYVKLTDLGRFRIEIRVTRIEPIPNAVWLEGHRAQEAADRRTADEPTETAGEQLVQCSD